MFSVRLCKGEQVFLYDVYIHLLVSQERVVSLGGANDMFINLTFLSSLLLEIYYPIESALLQMLSGLQLRLCGLCLMMWPCFFILCLN